MNEPPPAARSPRPARRDLRGLRAIVTGGSSGVGRAVALALCHRGARVLATARRQDRLAELAVADGPVEPIEHEAGDICDAGFRRHLVATAAERLGGIDLVVAAAGGGAIGPFRSADPATLGPVESEFWTALVDGERPGWSRGRGMPPDRVATAILAGLERRRGEIVPGWQAKGYAFLARFLPGLIDRWAARHWPPREAETGGPKEGQRKA